MVQDQVFWRVRLKDGRGLGNPGVHGWGLSHPPRTSWEAIPSAGRDLCNPFLQILCEEFWPRAVVYKLGCILEAPGEL